MALGAIHKTSNQSLPLNPKSQNEIQSWDISKYLPYNSISCWSLIILTLNTSIDVDTKEKFANSKKSGDGKK